MQKYKKRLELENNLLLFSNSLQTSKKMFNFVVPKLSENI